MPAQKKRKRKEQINLLPQKGFAMSTTGRVLLWILSTFRVIVIVTEIIVMIAFLSRFWLDAQNTDLNDEIQQKQAVLTSYSRFESDFKNAQKRLEIFSGLSADQRITSDAINEVSSRVPAGVYLTKASLHQRDITIEGLSPNETGIQQYIVNLQSSEYFNNIELSDISIDKESGFLFYKFSTELK